MVRHGGDVVNGYVEVDESIPSLLDLRISFEGIIRTWLSSDSFDRTGEYKFLQETQQLEPEHQTCQRMGEGYLHRISFRFVIPHQLISAKSDIPAEYLALPPSIKSGRLLNGTFHRSAYMQPLITYKITADLFERVRGVQRKICHQELEIRIMPKTVAAPPLQIRHFPFEFRTISKHSLRQHMWSRSMGELRISTTEPEALNIATTAPRATTTVFATLTYTPRRQWVSSALPYEWEIVVKYFLRSRTFYSSKPFVTRPIISAIDSDPHLEMHTETTKSESRRCCSLGWRLDRLSTHGTIKSEDAATPWTTFLKIPVNTSKHLAPTFLTALATRRYALCLSFNITGLYHSPIELEVPVQVIYDQPEVNVPGMHINADDGEGFQNLAIQRTRDSGFQFLDEPPTYSRFQ